MAHGFRINLQFNDFADSDLFLFFRRNDPSGHGSLNFHAFSAGVLPFSAEYASLVTDRPDFFTARGCPDITKFFSVETRLEYQAFWRAIFKAERAAEDLRQRIAARVYFNIHDAFAFCDRN